MTESVLATSLLTYRAGPAERAGRVRPIASRKGRIWMRLGDIAGLMRGLSDSVVENGLVDVQRLVQPEQAVEPAHQSQDRARQVRPCAVRAGKFGATQIAPG